VTRGQNRYPDKESSDGKSNTNSSSSSASQQRGSQQQQQHAFSAAALPPQRSLHEEVTQFLAAFNTERPEATAAHTAQVEELLNAVSHQLPSCCFRMSFEDNPLLRGVGAQFDQKRGGGE
jgi:hypothetical protein